LFTEAQLAYLRQHIGDETALQTVSDLLDTFKKQYDFQRRVFDSAPPLFVVVDSDGRIVEFNRACELLTGYTASEVFQHYIWEVLLIAETQQAVKAMFEDLQVERVPAESEIEWVTKAQVKHIIRLSSAILFDDNGEIEYVVSTGRDVTEKRQQHDTARAISESQLQVLFEQAPIGIVLTGVGLRSTISVNTAFVKILGYSIEELRNLNYDSYTHPDDLETERVLIEELFSGQREAYHLEKRYLHKDGHVVWGHFIGCIIRDPHGVPIYGMGILEDISERKQNEAQLAALRDKTQQMEKLYSLIAQNATDIILIISPMLDLVYVSPACHTVLGYQPDELMSMNNPYQLIHPDDKATVTEVLSSLSKDNQSVVLSSRLRHKNGRYVWLEDNLRVVLNPDDSVQEIIGIARDVSQRREYEDALAVSNQELEAFTTSVSHDLRAPLRTIEGFSRILLEEHAASLNTDAQRYLSMIRENALQMARLINDLLTLSRFSRQPLVRREVDMTAIVLETFAQIDQSQRVIDFTVDNLPPAQGDSNLLRVVFENLLRNAVKFTAVRSVAVIEVGWENQNEEVVYWVKDNGVGFNMEYANTLFQAFQRLHKDYEGTGIGLATVQRIIHRHGGRVWAYAEPDKGATFYFTLRGV
jgi:PAS domain S-box-containing protein